MLSANDLLQKMCSDLGMLRNHLEPIIRTAPLRYKVFYIEKKSGGYREVAQPAREVKAIQRWLIKNIFGELPVHDAATAYIKGGSIKANALRHVRSNYFLKLDFENFFPSISAEDLAQHLDKYCSEFYDESAVRLIVRACVWAPNRERKFRLCIGAPSSPILSNSVMFDFDTQVSCISSELLISYSRYADDLTFSCHRSGVLDSFMDKVVGVYEGLDYPRLSLNRKKTVFGSRASRRVVTGIVLTPDKKISIGRDQKRLIRAMYHKKIKGLLDDSEHERLAGLISYAENIEPGFLDWISKIKP